MTEESLVGGLHAVKALLKTGADKTEQLLVQRGRTDNRLRTLVDIARRADIPVRELSRRELDSIAGNSDHQGVVARHRGCDVLTENALTELIAGLSEPALIVILDGITDPHNLGACMRSADAAGVHAVVIPSDNSVGMTPVVRKVASGAAETIPLIQVTNLQRTIGKLQAAGVWVFGAAGEGDAELFDMDWKGPIALVMGSEGSGLRRLTRESCDGLFRIPMQGSVSSLNVSVATGVTLFEVVRQRRAS